MEDDAQWWDLAVAALEEERRSAAGGSGASGSASGRATTTGAGPSASGAESSSLALAPPPPPPLAPQPPPLAASSSLAISRSVDPTTKDQYESSDEDQDAQCALEALFVRGPGSSSALARPCRPLRPPPPPPLRPVPSAALTTASSGKQPGGSSGAGGGVDASGADTQQHPSPATLLPYHALQAVAALLPPADARRSRLVCKAWRAALAPLPRRLVLPSLPARAGGRAADPSALAAWRASAALAARALPDLQEVTLSGRASEAALVALACELATAHAALRAAAGRAAMAATSSSSSSAAAGTSNARNSGNGGGRITTSSTGRTSSSSGWSSSGCGSAALAPIGGLRALRVPQAAALRDASVALALSRLPALEALQLSGAAGLTTKGALLAPAAYCPRLAALDLRGAGGKVSWSELEAAWRRACLDYKHRRDAARGKAGGAGGGAGEQHNHHHHHHHRKGGSSAAAMFFLGRFKSSGGGGTDDDDEGDDEGQHQHARGKGGLARRMFARGFAKAFKTRRAPSVGSEGGSSDGGSSYGGSSGGGAAAAEPASAAAAPAPAVPLATTPPSQATKAPFPTSLPFFSRFRSSLSGNSSSGGGGVGGAAATSGNSSSGGGGAAGGASASTAAVATAPPPHHPHQGQHPPAIESIDEEHQQVVPQPRAPRRSLAQHLLRRRRDAAAGRTPRKPEGGGRGDDSGGRPPKAATTTTTTTPSPSSSPRRHPDGSAMVVLASADGARAAKLRHAALAAANSDEAAALAGAAAAATAGAASTAPRSRPLLLHSNRVGRTPTPLQSALAAMVEETARKLLLQQRRDALSRQPTPPRTSNASSNNGGAPNSGGGGTGGAVLLSSSGGGGVGNTNNANTDPSSPSAAAALARPQLPLTRVALPAMPFQRLRALAFSYGEAQASAPARELRAVGRLTALTSLEVSRCAAPDAALKAMIAPLTRLQRLSLSGAWALTDGGAKGLAASLARCRPGVASLALHEPARLSGSGAAALLLACAPTLERVSLLGAARECDAREVAKALAGMPRLRHAELGLPRWADDACGAWADGALRAAAKAEHRQQQQQGLMMMRGGVAAARHGQQQQQQHHHQSLISLRIFGASPAFTPRGLGLLTGGGEKRGSGNGGGGGGGGGTTLSPAHSHGHSHHQHGPPAAALRSLSLEDCPGVEAGAALAHAGALPPRLRELGLRGLAFGGALAGGGGGEDGAAIAIAVAPPACAATLTRLEVVSCPELTDAQARRAALLFPRLRALSLAHCVSVGDGAARAALGRGGGGGNVIGALPHLVSLDLSHTAVGRGAFEMTTKSPPPPPVEQLAVRGCPGFDDAAAALCAAALGGTLRRVDASGLPAAAFTVRGAEALLGMRALEHADFSGCRGIVGGKQALERALARLGREGVRATMGGGGGGGGGVVAAAGPGGAASAAVEEEDDE